jgi:hypothetical protein
LWPQGIPRCGKQQQRQRDGSGDARRKNDSGWQGTCARHAVAFCCKYIQTKCPMLKTIRLLSRKPREAPLEVLHLACLFRSAALAKPTAKPPCLVRMSSLFYWKATKSPNKHPLNFGCLQLVCTHD